jgi:hypothetical protein
MQKQFPSYRYHRSLAPVIVHNPDQDDALGSDWADTPAAFNTPEPVVEPFPLPVAEIPELPVESEVDPADMEEPGHINPRTFRAPRSARK